MASQVLSAVSVNSATTPSLIPSSTTDKSLKRKLEDALQSLDEAVGPTATPSGSPEQLVPKRLRTSRSIYSMLTRLSKKDSNKSADDLQGLSKTAPHLAAILSRKASRAAKGFPFKLNHASKFPGGSSPIVDYSPSSSPQFFARLATFKPTTYSNKPAAIDAVAAARCGWVNSDKDRLLCKICGVSWIVADSKGMTRDAANVLAGKQRGQLVTAHKDGCPWKARQCDETINRVSLMSPLATIREVKARAMLLDGVMEGVKIAHPLSNLQVQNLVSIIGSVSLPASADLDDSETSCMSDSISTVRSPQKDPSQNAILAAVFGWGIAPPPTASTASTSVSRASSLAPGHPQSRLSISRASSVSRAGTPSPMSASYGLAASASLLSQHALSTSALRSDTALIHCPLCQRRVGLWTYVPKPTEEDDPMTGQPAQSTPARPQPTLDILQQHRPYCAYVVRSSFIPTMPAPPTPIINGHSRSSSAASTASVSLVSNGFGAQSAMEGWRAVINVVLRYGTVQRQRLGMNRSQSAQVDDGCAFVEGQTEEVDAVDAMVAGVKRSGGSALMRYVRGLLS
ncbi:zf-C3HC-domain-containing protein [Epithele typhae]|uniref:zf-C3HC-domain-containing protein n=1 Tax=Epithele typhae TaxID=378194 RepID=UPI0020074C39|nr:zf-C3HC-domain-containing protein [Epithele typhae]KAH9945349.1 zf-C3HC-domain-containing protein [Epithele typhae]